MNIAKKNIAIIGAGNLGSRHFSSLANLRGGGGHYLLLTQLKKA